MKDLFRSRGAPSLFLATILERARQPKTEAPGRGRRPARRPLFESLENRTPLSAGVSIAPDTLTFARQPEFGGLVMLARGAEFAPQAAAFVSDAGAPALGGVTVGGLAGLVASRTAFSFESQIDAAGSVTSGPPEAPGGQPAGPQNVPPLAFAFRTGEFAELDDSGQFHQAFDTESGDGPPPMFGAFFAVMDFSMLAVARPAASPTEDDTTFAGPLPLDDSTDASLALMTNQAAAGRSGSSAVPFFTSGRSVQLNLNVEPSAADWMSYLAGWGSERPLAESTDASTAPLVLDDTPDLPDPPAAITAGEAPLGFLLSGADLPALTSQQGESQVAELVPSSESSLALTATLWDISSGVQTPVGDLVGSSGRALESAGSPGAPTPLTAFLVGLDGAVQQSSLDLREEIVAVEAPLAGRDRTGAAPDRHVEWQGPILPVGDEPSVQREQSGSATDAVPSGSRDGNSSRSRRAPHATKAADRQAQAENAQPQSHDASSLATALIPALSAISVSILGAGWFWQKLPVWMRSGSRTRKISRRQHG
jgi:hypothetical protein